MGCCENCEQVCAEYSEQSPAQSRYSVLVSIGVSSSPRSELGVDKLVNDLFFKSVSCSTSVTQRQPPGANHLLPENLCLVKPLSSSALDESPSHLRLPDCRRHITQWELPHPTPPSRHVCTISSLLAGWKWKRGMGWSPDAQPYRIGE